MSKGFSEKLEEFIEENSKVAQNVSAGIVRSAPINDPNFIHYVWLLGLKTSYENKYLDVLGRQEVEKRFPLTRFWRYYTKGIQTFSGIGKTFECEKPTTKGYEKFLEPYADYMIGGLSGEDFAAKAIESFKRRNSQKRMTDWKSLDGDAMKPVLWDLRKASITMRAQQNGGHNSGSSAASIVTP
ncbi:hypothetical protein [Coraliomargarita parva]|uniref:hypothetical protein n=1 Tax=Coraliomargarita parva TaxID=3014050 RepID=UPI0022B340EC|nr:hypothetical protein [Coraliomargarita parva]